MTYRRFRWLVEGQIAGAPHPEIGHDDGLPAVADFLHAEGIETIVTLQEKTLEPDPTTFGFRHCFFETPNFHPPDLDAVVRAIDEALHYGGVLVHCFAGIGRTGIALAAWLSTREPGLSVDDVVNRVRDEYIPEYARARFPEDPRQLEALEAFARR